MTTQSAPLTAASGSVPIAMSALGRLRPVGEPLLRLEFRRARHPQLELEPLGGVHPRSQHVVGVARPGHGLAADRAAMLLEGHDVGQHLAGMRAPRQAIDDRDGRVLRQLRDGVVIERADHDGVDIARQHARGVGDGLAAAELHLVGREHHRLAAELAHRDLEGNAGAGRRPLEDHGERLAGQRAVGGAAALALCLDGAALRDHAPQVVPGNVDQVEEMPHAVGAHPAAPCGDRPAGASSPVARRRARCAAPRRRSPPRSRSRAAAGARRCRRRRR